MQLSCSQQKRLHKKTFTVITFLVI